MEELRIVGKHGDAITDISTVLDIVDSEDQKLEIRVGSVYYGNIADEELGIWICYQRRDGRTPMVGPVLISPRNWKIISKYVNYQLKRKKRPKIISWIMGSIRLLIEDVKEKFRAR